MREIKEIILLKNNLKKMQNLLKPSTHLVPQFVNLYYVYNHVLELATISNKKGDIYQFYLSLWSYYNIINIKYPFKSCFIVVFLIELFIHFVSFSHKVSFRLSSVANMWHIFFSINVEIWKNYWITVTN